MAEEKTQLKDVYPIPANIEKMAYISGRAAYDKIWKRSIEEPDAFWGEIAGEYGSRNGTRSKSTISTSARAPSI